MIFQFCITLLESLLSLEFLLAFRINRFLCVVVRSSASYAQAAPADPERLDGVHFAFVVFPSMNVGVKGGWCNRSVSARMRSRRLQRRRTTKLDRSYT